MWFTVDPPLPRSHAAMVYDHDRRRTVLFGGATEAAGVLLPLDDCWELEDATGAWQACTVASRPAARLGHAMAYDGVLHRVVLAGGTGASPAALTDTWEYEGDTTGWSEVTDRTPARAGQGLVFDTVMQRVLMFGGLKYADSGRVTPAFDDWWLYDSADGWVRNDTWEYDGASWVMRHDGTSGAPSPRREPAIGFDEGHGRVVLFGGVDADTGELLSDTWEYDGAAGTWHQIVPTASSPQARRRGAMTFDADRQRVVMLGGVVRLGASIFESESSDLWEWDGSDWSARGATAAPLARSGAAAATSEAGHAVMFGGVAGDGQRAYLRDTWLWHGGMWARVAPSSSHPAASADDAMPVKPGSVPAARAGHGFALGRRLGFMFGGEGDSGLLADAWVWSDETLRWTELSPALLYAAPGSRVGTAVAAVADDAFILFGGRQHNDTLLRDTWRIRVTAAQVYQQDKPAAYGTWTKEPAGASPPARSDHAMVRDRSRNVVVMFGGRSASGPLADLWEYNPAAPSGSRWIDRTPSISPPRRFGHQLTFDDNRGRVVLTGGVGATADELLADTWEWDGAAGTWSLRMPVGRPSPRAGHVTFFDPSTGDMTLFGGLAYGIDGSAVSTYGDTWVLEEPDASDVGPPRYPRGYPCSAPTFCETGFCVDGVCCESVCAGQCEGCAEPGSEGQCVAVAGAARSNRPPCGGMGDCAPRCDGDDVLQCHAPDPGSACGAEQCANGSHTFGGSCDASGACVTQNESCWPWGCANQTCAATCNAQTPCFPGYFCYTWQTSFCRQKAVLQSFDVQPAGSVPVGTWLTMQALATSTTPNPPPGLVDYVVYRFLVSRNGGPEEMTCGDYWYDGECWTFASQPGTYVIRVEVKNEQSPDIYDDVDEVTVEVTP